VSIIWREDEYYQRLAAEYDRRPSPVVLAGGTEGIATAIPSSRFTRLARAIRRHSPDRSIIMEPTTTRFGRFPQDPQPYPAPPTYLDGLAYAPPLPPTPPRKSRKPRAMFIAALLLIGVAIAAGAAAKSGGQSTPSSYSDYRNPDVLAGAIKSTMQAKLAAKGADITVTSVDCLPKEKLRFVCMATDAEGDHASSTVTVSADGQSFISDTGGN
jgi:hypothetical protein